MPPVKSATITALDKKLSEKQALADSYLARENRKQSLWDGPYEASSHGGLTFSMLSRWLCCRESFRLYAVEGIKTAEAFDGKMEYGNLWHTCEEYLAAGQPWEPALLKHAQGLGKRYPQNSHEVLKWYNICKIQFPIYVKHWAKHEDVKTRQPYYQEHVFNVPYTLPSGRVVNLRGKFDSVDTFSKNRVRKLYLQENKSKSEVGPTKIVADLSFELQTMMYLIVLSLSEEIPVGGIRYNVIRRPLSGWGKYNIQQKKGMGKAKKGAETEEQFYQRLGELIKENAGNKEAPFFFRCRAEVSQQDLDDFKNQCLNPVLEQLCDWWDSIKDDPFNPWMTHGKPNKYNFRWPYGVWNAKLEGRGTRLDNFMATGDMDGLQRVENLFTELG